MQAVAGADRARPLAQLGRVKLPCETGAERPVDVAQRGQIEVGRKHGRVAQGIDPRRRSFGGQALQDGSGIRFGGGAAPIAADEDLPECQARLGAVFVRVLREPGLELVVCRRAGLGAVLDQELELLPQAPAHHAVVAIEARGHRFAHGDLLAHPLVDQPLEFGLGRRPRPGAREARLQVRDLPGADDDARRSGTGATAGAEVEEQEQRRADGEEVQQRFPEDGFQAH
jgi:hypothetical protein